MPRCRFGVNDLVLGMRLETDHVRFRCDRGIGRGIGWFVAAAAFFMLGSEASLC